MISDATGDEFTASSFQKSPNLVPWSLFHGVTNVRFLDFQIDQKIEFRETPTVPNFNSSLREASSYKVYRIGVKN